MAGFENLTGILSEPSVALFISLIGIVLVLVGAVIFKFMAGGGGRRRQSSQPSSPYNMPYGNPLSSINADENVAVPIAAGKAADESVISPNSFKLNLEIMLLMVVLSSFPMAALAIYAPELFWLGILVGVSTSFIVGIGIGFVLSTSFRIKVLRKLTKRNYGYAKYVYGDSIIKPVLMDLDNDVLRFNDGIYIPGRGNIKRTAEEVTAAETKSLSSAKFEQKIKFEEGIPTIYFNIDDMMPLEFSLLGTSTNSSKGDYRIPKQVAATLNKEIAVEKAKALNAIKRTADILLVVAIAASICAAFFGYNLWSTDEQKMTLLIKINGFVESIASQLPALSRQISQGTTTK